MRYWVIGTHANKMVNAFIHFVSSKSLVIGDEFIVNEQNQYFILMLKNGKVLWRFRSSSTCRQYLKTWEALGFTWRKNNAFRIATMIKDYNLISLYSLLFITQNSNDESIQAYRNTIIINILVEAKVITTVDLRRKNVHKTKGVLKIKDIHKAISKYEKKLAKNTEIVKILKDRYDGKF